ncbi:SEFIR domain-containing protein [Actinokineospora enzanensis]|uniref:SEFIR domain-containing protein n=1 Tax=Actinokineospora enzanensis TaxID=155975 RepID=UPI0003681B00|nr:SEFIR domain-containing protein [Actinokineospora enzanensis]
MQQDPDIEVTLALVDNTGRRIDDGPAEVAVGQVRLGRWQVHSVTGAGAATFPGKVAHLVKIGYDLRLRPDAPVVRSFEVDFSLLGRDSAVVAAVPEGAAVRRPATSYALSRVLEFVPVADVADADVHIPPTGGPVHVYGTGGDSIRWRHVGQGKSGVHPGSYSAWIVLLAPEGSTTQGFRVTARFDPEPDGEDDLRPTPKSGEFEISLAASAQSPAVSARNSDIPGIALPDYSPQVFICYVHENESWKEQVRSFANLLRSHGTEPRIDEEQEGPRTEWDQWALREIRAADFVIVIASPTCRAVGDGTYEGAGHPGIRSELRVIRNLLQRYPDWEAHVLPVVLPGAEIHDIPMLLGPYTLDHYIVEALIGSELEYLLKAIRSTPRWRGWDEA